MNALHATTTGRRAILRALAGGAAAALLPRPAAAAGFDVLHRPALASAKAAQATTLAVARAGRRLVATGERGIVVLSDDEGRTWRQAEVPVSVALTGVRFADERHGWAVGHLGVVLATQDGGEHWHLQLDGLQVAQRALQAAGDDAKASAAARALADDGPDKPFLDVYFLDTMTGYAVGAFGLAFRTDDGGAHWQPWMDHLPNPKGLHLYAIVPDGEGLYVAGEQGLLLRSRDGGGHFESVATPSKGTFFGAVAGHDGELLLYGLRGRAFRTVDASRTWSEIDTGAHASLSAGTRLADGRWLLASQSGELMLSRDDGRSFQPAGLGNALPVTGLVQAAGGALVLTTLRGVRRLELPAAT